MGSSRSAINSSLTNTMLAQVLDCNTSHEIWNTLSSLFSACSFAHFMQTQFQLATLKKGSETISEYFHKATALSSTLSAACHPLSPSEFNVYLLAGLGSDYESIVTSITTRLELLSSAQFFSYLLNHESWLAHQTHSLLFASLVFANSTVTQPIPPSYNKGRGRGSRGRGPPTPHSNFFAPLHAQHTKFVINRVILPSPATTALTISPAQFDSMGTIEALESSELQEDHANANSTRRDASGQK
ncbi:hypothetical protein F0562_002722 [Nyssa sinensis]|uniref:Retrotransposon gag domain-containing protein n=1 Tax=Nyssa sinensis TaxID=561372 RepID=A0A5J5BU81_9ASTE|nr:hypothetical protein F0562_002722 [Nyssa sinensis]